MSSDRRNWEDASLTEAKRFGELSMAVSEKVRLGELTVDEAQEILRAAKHHQPY